MAAIILRHLNESAILGLGQFVEILRIGTSELVDVLVVIAHGYHPHFFVGMYEGSNQGIIILAHILRFVDYEHSLADAIRLHFSCIDHFCRLSYHVSRLVQIAHSAQQVEAIRMESLDLYKVGGVADELHQALFKFGGCCTREGEHQELLMLYIFQ